MQEMNKYKGTSEAPSKGYLPQTDTDSGRRFLKSFIWQLSKKSIPLPHGLHAEFPCVPRL